jgi:transposase-like protein
LSAKGFKETISSFRRVGIKPKVCPKCGSADVSVLTLTGYVTQPIYSCNRCGFQGYIFLEISREKKGVEEKGESTIEEEQKKE